MIPGSPRPPAVLAAVLLVLAGCRGEPAASPGAATGTPPTTETAAVPAVPASSVPLTVASGAPPVDVSTTPVAAAAAGSPEAVLQDWAAAIERRDWAAVRRLWGHGGADSGLGPAAFARRWDRLRRPRVTIGAGEQEGAAGSLYYTAEVTLHDGARHLTQPVTIRRVNDVDGATPEQLRWHLEASARVQLPD